MGRRPRSCEICRRLLRAGDDYVRARLFAGAPTSVVHVRCLREDWERIEDALDHPWPLIGQKRT